MFRSRRILLGLTSALVLGTTAAMAPALSSAGTPSASSPQVASQHRVAGSYTSAVRGTWRNGVVHGSFVPMRSFVQHGETMMQGDLIAKFRRADGTVVGRATRHDVAIPVNASGAHTSSAAEAR